MATSRVSKRIFTNGNQVLMNYQFLMILYFFTIDQRFITTDKYFFDLIKCRPTLRGLFSNNNFIDIVSDIQ